MSVITIHAEDFLVDAVKDYAAQLGISMNKAAKRLLLSSLGMTAERPRAQPSFLACAGSLKDVDCSDLIETQKVFSQIDSEDWK